MPEALSGLPKVGKKTAEQIILTLKGKLVSIDDVVKGRSEALTQITSVPCSTWDTNLNWLINLSPHCQRIFLWKRCS